MASCFLKFLSLFLLGICKEMPTFFIIMDNDRGNFDYHPTRWRWGTFFFLLWFFLFILQVIRYLQQNVANEHGSFDCHLTTQQWDTLSFLWEYHGRRPRQPELWLPPHYTRVRNFLFTFFDKKFIIIRYLQWNDANDYRGWRHLWFPPRPTPWQWKGFLFFFLFS